MIASVRGAIIIVQTPQRPRVILFPGVPSLELRSSLQVTQVWPRPPQSTKSLSLPQPQRFHGTVVTRSILFSILFCFVLMPVKAVKLIS